MLLMKRFCYDQVKSVGVGGQEISSVKRVLKVRVFSDCEKDGLLSGRSGLIGLAIMFKDAVCSHPGVETTYSAGQKSCYELKLRICFSLYKTCGS